MQPQHIVSLHAENVKRLKAVRITPSGDLVVIGGRNAQGKTSVLDAITYAFAGKSALPERPIRDGEASAQVVCETQDLIVTRTFTPAGSYLKVTGKDGEKIANPQGVLDQLAGSLTFDPLGFLRLKPRDQLDQLKGLVGLSFEREDAERERLYAQRTEVNRSIDAMEARMRALPHHPEAPEVEVSVSDLAKELSAAKDRQNARAQAATALSVARQEDEKIRQQIADAERMLEALRAKRGDQARKIEHLTKELAAAPTDDVAAIERHLEEAEGLNRQVRENATRTMVETELKKAVAEADGLTDRIRGLDAEKAKALAAAKFPVPGLSFDETGLLFNGKPFAQASGAEQLRVSVAMALALNPTLRVALIRDGSLLDADSLRLVAELAAEHGAQLWVERVGAGEEVSVVIEDGEVIADRASEPAPGSAPAGMTPDAAPAPGGEPKRGRGRPRKTPAVVQSTTGGALKVQPAKIAPEIAGAKVYTGTATCNGGVHDRGGACHILAQFGRCSYCQDADERTRIDAIQGRAPAVPAKPSAPAVDDDLPFKL